MTTCELLEGCIFFNGKMQEMPATAGMIKERLCRGDNSECARYMVFRKLGRSRVPLDLFPNDAAGARRILAATPPDPGRDPSPV